MQAFHEISERDHRILNPLSEPKLLLLGELCRVTPMTRVLDLACGKGELLCRWAVRWGCAGVGVDTSPAFLAAARQRGEELGVSESVDFVEHDAATFVPPADPRDTFDLVTCIGASWIGGGLAGTIDLLRRHASPGPDSLLAVGEVYWKEPPGLSGAGEPPDLIAPDPAMFGTLRETMERCEAAGVELIDMVLASDDDWDRYQASQWHNVTEWLAENPEHPDAPTFRARNYEWRRAYLDYGRRRWGWGVFVLRP